jgi:methylenetetrahydrofolate dehydrogenase (NADP+)/methenyltetrahydrofolate cyclohydrolase
VALSGSDLASYIKLNQLHIARSLIHQGYNLSLDIIVAAENNLPIEKYIKFKQQYGEDIGVEVRIHRAKSEDLLSLIKKLNQDDEIKAMILQLPIDDGSLLEQALNLIEPEKDVDGLNSNSKFDSATATAILWLLGGYNINLEDKNIYLVGKGRLVGAPLFKMLTSSGFKVTVLTSKDDLSLIKDADLIISATGKAGLITSDLVKPGAIVVDAGTAGEDGVIRGDAADELYQRDDISITPKIGGVGPLTISALFGNVIKAYQNLSSEASANED